MDKRIIDISLPEGNAYSLLGQAKRWAREIGLDDKEILAEMTSGEYEHLVTTFEKHFGSFCTIEGKSW
jgi:hypothetical protein